MISPATRRAANTANGWRLGGEALHSFIEIASEASNPVGGSLVAARAIAGFQAYRKYDWIRNVPVLNEAGNLRGMVVSARWAAVFHFADKSADVTGKVTLFASLGANIAQSFGDVEDILQSNDPWSLKGARLADQVASICLRTAGGKALGAMDLAAQLTSSSLGLAGRAGLPGAAGLARNISVLDRRFDAWFNTVTDGKNLYLVTQQYIPQGWIRTMF